MKFEDIQFTKNALTLAKEKIAKTKRSERRYLEQALANEYESIRSVEHQLMTSADVLRVCQILNIK